MDKKIIIICGVFMIFSIFGFMGFGDSGNFPVFGGVINSNKGPVCGGVTDRSYDAPKKINSKNIVSLKTKFYVEDFIDRKKSGIYLFDVKKKEDGSFELVSGHKGDTAPISRDELLKVQEIIDRHNLANLNGTDRVTAGLAPEYSPSYLYADYDSGERLGFRINGNPDAKWAYELKCLFAGILAKGGHPEYLQSRDAFIIDRFSIEFGKGSLCFSYGIITCTDKVKRFYKRIYDTKAGKTVCDQKKDMSDEVFDGLQKTIEECGLDDLAGCGHVSFHTKHDEPEGYYEIYIDYKNGRQIYREASGSKVTAEWPPMRDAIVKYFDSVFK